MFKTLYQKCLNLASHKSSNFFLGLVSFIESSFFPIPPDVMIIPMVIAKKKELFKNIFNCIHFFSSRWHIWIHPGFHLFRYGNECN